MASVEYALNVFQSVVGEVINMKRKAKSVQGIYDELMATSKSFRENTPRTRETRVKRIHTLRTKKSAMW
jgi:hypothetical protein